MRKFIIISIVLIIVVVIAYLFFTDEGYKNEIVLTNNVVSTSTMKIVCEPHHLNCPMEILHEKSAVYKNIEKFEIYVGSWYEYHQYDLYPPNRGKFELKLNDIIDGNIPKRFKIRCYSGEYNKPAIELNCKTKKPLAVS